MNDPSTGDNNTQEEIALLVRQFHEIQRRLQELAAGVDTVVQPDGQAYLLHEAQEKLRQSEQVQRERAATQTAILNSLPAHIALIDENGVIQSVNEAWRHFASANSIPGAEYG